MKSVADLERNGDDVGGDAVRPQVDRVDATVVVRTEDDGGGCENRVAGGNSPAPKGSFRL
jgi:hypothetical protein